MLLHICREEKPTVIALARDDCYVWMRLREKWADEACLYQYGTKRKSKKGGCDVFDRVLACLRAMMEVYTQKTGGGRGCRIETKDEFMLRAEEQNTQPYLYNE